MRLIARNNEVLATTKTDARGYARFEAGLKSGEGGLAPAVLVAETGAGDYAFLDLSTGAFDLTDRGVEGRTAPGPIDAFAYTDRGVYRAGEQVYLTALARDRTGKASGVPVTVPEAGVQMVEAIWAKDYERAQKIQVMMIEHSMRMAPLRKLYGRTTTLEGLRLRGLRVKQYARWPSKPMSPNCKAL